MLRPSPEMPQHLILAIEHHERLLEEAQRLRLAASPSIERPLRWRRLRFHVGGWLIRMGQRLKPDATDATDAVWG